ncbi:uncharacterized protein LOC124634839 [Helicoverpa zea]|uniref:uncharacterized protein LOC124631960 n=1 Tax=Helicoverpa zea TaxID=7113 RepID=UPI001F5A57D8|nr:uncharacterized protein LOC124631960 [Helicoverpa zea]XP_047026446.1 uncharacterized protein LOC124634839 [Helicoverpa zea]
MNTDDLGAGPSGLQAQHVRTETASDAEQRQQPKRRGPKIEHDVKILSPKKKRSKQTPLHSAEKTTVLNIYKDIKGSQSESTPAYMTQLVNKTAEIAGISRATVYNILKEYNTEGRLQSPPPRQRKYSKSDEYDDIILSGIRRKIHSFFFDNELPTLDKILEAVNSDESLPDFKRSTLYNLIKNKLKFTYIKRSRRSALIDRQEIVLWRVKYLHEIKRLRNEGKKIYYLDETWLNEGHTKSKVWQDSTVKSSKEAHRAGLSTGLKNPTGKGKRLIIGHIGSTDGFLMNGELIFEAKKGDGDYHSEMDAHNFEKWFSLILSKIESGSVIVMDNAPYHSRKVEKLPTTATRKADIQEWLKNKNIPFEEKDLRATLLEKVKHVKHLYQKFVVDDMAKEKNVLVLRLPPYHCELNPIELIWAQMKGYVAQNNKSFKLKEVQQLLPQALANITAEKWQSCIAHTIKEEERFCQLDGIMDEVVERFIINVGESSSSSEDDE